MLRLPILFLHHANIRHYHAAINGFTHVVNGKKLVYSVKKIKGLEGAGDSGSPILKD